MRIRRRLLFGIAWLLSLIAVAVTVKAQRSTVFTPLPQPKVITGADIGFRLEGTVGDIPAGSFVVRVNGRWVEPTGSPRQSVRSATE